jgi:peptidoglycan/xylan/chitin deacetylase (PgdA/CDA1 family)
MMLLSGACATARPAPEPGAAAPAPGAPRTARPAPPAPPPPPKVEPLPEAFESEDFVVTFARPDDTPETLAARHLGDAARAWMIEEYMGTRIFSSGQEVIIPKRFWNPVGVEPSGYQLVPILTYHNLDLQAKGRLVLAIKSFEEQMRYLKREGYRAISLGEFLEFASQRRQLPRKTVVLTFDDGYKSFRMHAVPLLKELGFTATLFVYTDYVGAGRHALSWQELRELQAEGFEIHAHSKTHGDLRRTPGESDATYARRLQAELEQPLALFKRHLGRTSEVVAYPYGKWDDEVARKAREYGYTAGFSVRRQGNPSFVFPLGANRSQIYSEMTTEDFAKNLNVFHEETLK